MLKFSSKNQIKAKKKKKNGVPLTEKKESLGIDKEGNQEELMKERRSTIIEMTFIGKITNSFTFDNLADIQYLGKSSFTGLGDDFSTSKYEIIPHPAIGFLGRTRIDEYYYEDQPLHEQILNSNKVPSSSVPQSKKPIKETMTRPVALPTVSKYTLRFHDTIPQPSDILKNYKDSVFLQSSLYRDMLEFISDFEAHSNENYPIRMLDEIFGRYLSYGNERKRWKPNRAKQQKVFGTSSKVYTYAQVKN